MTNKEIRSLPLPKLTTEVRSLASQCSTRKPLVLTVQKVKSFVCMNVFLKEDDEINLIYRYFWKEKECLLYNLKTNKISKGFLTSTWERTYRTGYDYVCVKKDLNKLIRWTNYAVKDDKEPILWSVIYSAEEKIRKYRSALRQKKVTDAIDAIMKPVKNTIPRGFEKTIAKTMEHSQYMFFSREEKTAVCSCCESTFTLKELPRFKEREEGKCPKCNKKVKHISIKRKKHIYDTGMAVVFQAHSYHVMVERYFHISYDYRESVKPNVRYAEVRRNIVDYDKNEISEYEWYYYKGGDKKRWCPPQRTIFNSDGFHYDYLKGELHRAGLNAEIKKAGLSGRFDGMEKMADVKLPGYWGELCYQNVRYYELIAVNPFIERFVKCGLINLATHFFRGSYSYYSTNIDRKATTLLGTLQLKNKAQMKECIERNITYEDLGIVQRYNGMAVKPRSVAEIIRIYKVFGSNTNAFYYSDSKLRKMEKYFDQVSQTNDNYKEHRSNLVNDYFDYLNNCEKLDYDMNSELVLYPKHFKEAHDMAATNVKAKNLEKTYAAIAKLLPEMHKLYDFEGEELFITAPNSGKEITYEGQAMKHCVGTYVDRVAKGETVILFIRKKAEPNKPYVTMEVRNHKVIQVRAFGNGTPSNEVQELVKQFKMAKNVA